MRLNSTSPLRIRFVLLAVLAAWTASLAAAQPSPLDGFDAYVKKAVADWEVPGLAVAVVQDGEVVFAEGYGVRALGSGGAVDEHTLFAVGSTTKAMTAAAVGMLVDRGKLAWDDPVAKHLPGYQLSDPYVTREITVRDLLSHRTGVANPGVLWYEQDRGTAELLECMRHAEQQASLRSRFLYNNLMYAAAGEVVAAASGVSWAEFLKKRLFEPLGMTRTVASLAEAAGQPNVASPHDLVDGTLAVVENASVDNVAAAGAVWSSVHDMARWLAFLLRGGVTESGERLLSEESHRELFTPQIVLRRVSFYPTARLTKPHWITYGFGWFQIDYTGRAVDFHTGSIDGMVAIAGLLRDQGLGVYVLANRDHAEVRHALMYRVFDLYGERGEPRDWSAELRDLYGSLRAEAEAESQKRAEARVPDTEPSLPLERYAGTYEDDICGRIEVTLADGDLHLRFGRRAGTLAHWHYDTFQALFPDAWRGRPTVTFALDGTGRPARLETPYGTFERAE